ncbi:Nin one binding (NOB1) Zn-ribbon-like - like 1 [Theobroma cacao]|nr:Nin one binding (NOB1) Zn-ribbon-like - like 1 [Theobroma cacao]
MEDSGAPAPNPNPAPCWSNVLKSQPPKPQTQKQTAATTQLFVESCKSTKGIAVAVVDANAVIEGGEKLNNSADRFVTVPEVLAEIRDPVSRHRLAFIPFSIDSMEPSSDALNKVHVVNVKRLPERDLPGWGSNVPNLDEWEALEREAEGGTNSNSRILPLKDLNMNTLPSDNGSEDGSVEIKSETHSENQEDVEHGFRRPRRYLPQKKEVKIEGKKMVADGIDASQGQIDDNGDNWQPAVSRSTHRRYLRRKARREYYEALVEKDCQEDMEKSMDKNNVEDAHSGNGILEETERAEEKKGDEDLSSILKQMRLEEDSLEALQEAEEVEITVEANVNLSVEGNKMDLVNEELDQLEMSSQTNETVDASYTDDVSSEQSWMLRSLSESSVACVTGDFAMQNVILQMGLRLLAPGGMQIRQLHRWILKCHACYNVTAEIGRIFCPKCGNGGTLRKVAVTVGENGIVLASHRPRISLRGTKFSLPLPQGGRDAITKNLILREDQLPQKFLYPKTKKKVNKQGDDDLFMGVDTFTHHTDKRAPLQPPVRKALAVFSGKRNPNDNHYSRSKHK